MCFIGVEHNVYSIPNQIVVQTMINVPKVTLSHYLISMAPLLPLSKLEMSLTHNVFCLPSIWTVLPTPLSLNIVASYNKVSQTVYHQGILLFNVKWVKLRSLSHQTIRIDGSRRRLKRSFMTLYIGGGEGRGLNTYKARHYVLKTSWFTNLTSALSCCYQRWHELQTWIHGCLSEYQRWHEILEHGSGSVFF